MNLVLREVRFGFSHRMDFLGPVNMATVSGDRWAFVGPNGAGKSTLLRLLAGLHRPSSGEVLLDHIPLHSVPPRTRARRIAYLPQHPPVDLSISVLDLVIMGRFPLRSFGLFESIDDHRIAGQALKWMNLETFAERRLSTLSGGEAQRAHLAAALAQQPDLLLLDEPTNSLDVPHQYSLMDQLRTMSENDGPAIIFVTHDVNLAARFSTKALLLHEGRVMACGTSADVVTPSILERAYGMNMATLEDPSVSSGRWIIPIDSRRRDPSNRE